MSSSSKKASFGTSFGLFILAIALVFGVRWWIAEPFVIPSGSMIPTLLIHDHILVTKFSYGVRWPFSKRWMIEPQLPQRGDVVVFRSVEKDDYFMIKRVVGLPGDVLRFDENGQWSVNGVPVPSENAEFLELWSDEDLGSARDDFVLRRETLGAHPHFALHEKSSLGFSQPGVTVTEGHIFLMGDNRDRSRDSRFWGELPVENLMGRARFVWLSCSQVLVAGTFLCDPRYIRWQRFFHRIE